MFKGKGLISRFYGSHCNCAFHWPGKMPSDDFLLVFGMAALLALGLAREARRFGLDASDPFTVRAGWSNYKPYTITGTALSPTKSRVVTTHVSGGGGGAAVSSSTSISIHDQFFVRDTSGREEDFKLTNMDIALREGHEMSVVRGIKKGKKSGYNLLFRNHSTRRADFIDRVVRDMLRPHKWLVLPLMAATSIVIYHTGDRLIMGKGLPVDIEKQAQEAIQYGFPVAALAIFFFVRRIVIGLRLRRLKRRIVDKLVPVLDKQGIGSGREI